MKNKVWRILFVLSCLIVLSGLLTSCISIRYRIYYPVKDNYIEVSGVVSYMKYSDDHTELHIAFSDMDRKLDDRSFEIVGENLRIVEKNGIDDKIKIGDRVTFVTAPKYFGDGYVMPIVAISANGESLLDFDEGFKNFMDYLNIRVPDGE